MAEAFAKTLLSSVTVPMLGTCAAPRARSRSRSPRRTGATTPAAPPPLDARTPLPAPVRVPAHQTAPTLEPPPLPALDGAGDRAIAPDGTDARASAPTVPSPHVCAGLAKWLNLTETEKDELADILKFKLSMQAIGGNTTRERAAHSAVAQRSLSVWVLKVLCARPWGRRAHERGLLGPPCPRTLAAWHHLAERRSACRDGTQRRRVYARIWRLLDAMTYSFGPFWRRVYARKVLAAKEQR